VLSTAAWQAATPLPGTTTAWTPFRNSSFWSTQVADAMTTRPVPGSAAMTDQVANAVDGAASTSARISRADRIEGLQIDRMAVDSSLEACPSN